MGVKITNNASATLAASITDSATTLTVTSGQGALFPTLTGADYCWLTLVDVNNNVEVTKCTARSTDSFTIVRAQDNTTARAFAISDRLELRPTAALFDEFANPLSEKGLDIASASPLVITAGSDYFDVTGTTNFAAMTVAVNRQFTLQFDGVLTMTHHATNLDLPGAANITTAAGDVATFQSTGANTVQCINYTKADGTAVVGTSLDGAVTINETGADVDFRVESGNDANALFIQGSDGKVGIGTSSPLAKIHSSNGVPSGFTAADGGADELLISDSGTEVGMTIASASVGTINFADGGAVRQGRIRYEHVTDNLQLWTNNEERLRISSTGNVSIPSGNLDVTGTANVGNITATTGADLATSSGQVVVGASSGSTWAAANMFISSTTGAATSGYSSIVIGNLNNATSSHRGAGFLFVSANAATGGSDNDDIYFGHRNNAGTGEGAPSIISSYKTSGADTSDLRFRYGTGAGGASTEAMRIHSSGNVGIGRSSPSHILHINGVGRSTQSTWATSSDERVKENIVNHEAALDKINQLRPVSFNFKKEYRDNNSTETGFISQEFKLVFPDAVQEVEENYGKLTETDEETQETTVIDEGTTITDFNVLSTACLLPAMVKAIQEQNALIEALTARIEVLEA